MRWMWLWSGPCFGFREGPDVWTYEGRYVGRFQETEMYAPSGRYLGEIRNRDRLVTDRSKLTQRCPPFEPMPVHPGHARFGDELGYPVTGSISDFPSARKFRES